RSREPDAALPAPGERGPHDPAGEVLGHLSLPDLLASGHARRLACPVGAGPHRPLRGGEDGPRLAAALTLPPRASPATRGAPQLDFPHARGVVVQLSAARPGLAARGRRGVTESRAPRRGRYAMPHYLSDAELKRTAPAEVAA